jgi:hypothetical protein
MADIQATTGSRCRNCGSALHGQYCSACGQKDRGSGLDAGELVSETVDTIVRPDSKLWRTIVDLTRNPGQVAKDYVSGKRARYVNPIRYCLAAVALSIALSISSGEIAALSNSLVFGLFSSAPNDPAFARIAEFLAKYLNAMSLVAVPIYALVLKLLFRRSPYSYADHFSFVCFIVGQGAFLCIFGTLFNMYVYFVGLLPAFLLTNAVYIYGAMRFYNRGFWAALSYISAASVIYMTLIYVVAWLWFVRLA